MKIIMEKCKKCKKNTGKEELGRLDSNSTRINRTSSYFSPLKIREIMKKKKKKAT